MAQLADCPDELLLNIAANLRSRDLKALALTARKYRGAAQEALHTHIKVGNDTTLVNLLRTLVERPDLASKIHSIDWVVEHEYLYHSFQDEIRLLEETRSKFVIHTRHLTSQWSVDMTLWVQNVHHFDFVACTGLLLLLVSRLKHLSIDDTTVTPARLFGQKESSDSLKSIVSAVPALAGLLSLSIPSTHYDRHWYSLPQLQYLEVNCTSKFPQPAKLGPITSVHTLTIRCPATFCVPTPGNDSFDSFVESFSDLKRLNVSIFNWTESREWVPGRSDYIGIYSFYFYIHGTWETIRRPYYRSYYNPGLFSGMIKNINKVAPFLQELEVSSAERDFWLGKDMRVNYLKPVDMLQNFTQLKRLSIPQGAFVNATTYEVDPTHPLHVLPPNLEYMCVYDPTPAVVNWLSGILDDRDKLRNLKTVLLDFEWNQRNKVSDYREAAGEAGRRLWEAGVDFRYENACEGCR
jgi:hypothetical protein